MAGGEPPPLRRPHAGAEDPVTECAPCPSIGTAHAYGASIKGRHTLQRQRKTGGGWKAFSTFGFGVMVLWLTPPPAMPKPWVCWVGGISCAYYRIFSAFLQFSFEKCAFCAFLYILGTFFPRPFCGFFCVLHIFHALTCCNLTLHLYSIVFFFCLLLSFGSDDSKKCN